MKIYVLIDPRTGEIRYVGVTSRTLKQRLASHVQSKHKCLKYGWIKSLQKLGLEPEIQLLQTVGETEWTVAERYWIAYFTDAGCRLTNMTEGGEGAPGCRHSEESKLKRSNSMLGHVPTEETRAKISTSRKGTKATAGTIVILSMSHMGHDVSTDTRRKISMSQTAAHVLRKAARLAWLETDEQ